MPRHSHSSAPTVCDLPLGLERSSALEPDGGSSRTRARELVGAALGDDVDDAAGRLAELRLVAAGLDLHFLDEVERTPLPSEPKTIEYEPSAP